MSSAASIVESSAESIAAAIRDSQGSIIPTGAGTKAALSAGDAAVMRLDIRQHSGIVSYDPSEFLISAKAGTTLAEIEATLSAHQQYLPFDPLFVAQGATLAGTVASGLSGAGRLLYGSLRDFIMEVQLVDGLGQLVRGGGKVVKNAAGFDLPKLVVGSYGRLGVLTEITLKVFPRPPACATLRCQASSWSRAITAVQALLAQPLPTSAVDAEPTASGGVTLWVRYAAPSDSLPQVLRRAAEVCSLTSDSISDPQQEQALWRSRAADLEQHATHQDRYLVRIASTLPVLAGLIPDLLTLSDAHIQCTGAGSVTWLSLPAHEQPHDQLASLSALLEARLLPAIVISGPVSALTPLGATGWLAQADLIQRAIDPQHKFLSYQP